MFKRLSIGMAGLGLVLMSAGPALAQQTATTRSDAAITTAVKTNLLNDKTVGGLKIDVDTNDGVVTLTGPVRSAAEKAQAVKVTRDTRGVTRVVNKLTVDEKAATGTSGRDETKIVIKDDTTPALKKAGEATKKAAKKTADAVKDTSVRVKDDTPKVKIKDDTTPQLKKAGDKTADAAITSAVKTKLLADARVSGLKIDVDTTAGVVTLNGTVASASEKSAAVELARTTTGVKKVVDKLKIE